MLKTSFIYFVLVNNTLCGKLLALLESPTTFDEIFKVSSAPFVIPNVNLLSCKLHSLSLKCYIE